MYTIFYCHWIDPLLYYSEKIVLYLRQIQGEACLCKLNTENAFDQTDLSCNVERNSKVKLAMFEGNAKEKLPLPQRLNDNISCAFISDANLITLPIQLTLRLKCQSIDSKLSIRKVVLYQVHSSFYKHLILCNNANIWKKNYSNKILPTMSIELLDLWFQVQGSPFWTNLAVYCKTGIIIQSCSIGRICFWGVRRVFLLLEFLDIS